MRAALKPTNTPDSTLSRIQDAVGAVVNDIVTYKQDALQIRVDEASTIFVKPGEIVIPQGPKTEVRVVLPDPTQYKNARLGVGRTETTKIIRISNGDMMPATKGIREYVSVGGSWLLLGV